MKINLNDLKTFSEVVKTKNFTKAAAYMGVTQSAVSQSINNLEAQLGIKLLNRSTRSLTLTEAGSRLIELVGQNIENIDLGIEQISSMKNLPSGHVRISADAFTIKYYLWPKLKKLVKQYPDISLELTSENRRIDIAKEGYDAGVRVGNLVEKDLIAVPISKEIPFRLVASPEYLEKYGTPQSIDDLKKHKGIYIRLLTDNSLMAWEFKDKNKSVFFRGPVQLVMTSLDEMLDAVLDGCAVAYLPYFLVKPALEEKKLVSLLEQHAVTLPPFYLFYTSRRLMSPAFKIVKDTLSEI